MTNLLTSNQSERLPVDQAKADAAFAQVPGAQRLAMALSWAMEFTGSAILHALVAHEYSKDPSLLPPMRDEVRTFLLQFAPDKPAKINVPIPVIKK